MGEEIKKLILKGYIQRPAYNLVAKWIKLAWDQVDPNLIKRLFKCCGISIAQDVFKEDIMFDYNWVANPESRNSNGNYVYVNEDASNSESIVDLTLNDNIHYNNENDGGSDSLGKENRNDDSYEDVNENGSN
ncbi:3022_t:CDS:1 [Gigaspora rosea]|nr:3022_t:CDS:1 [Gigaspora rosea]